MKRLEVIAAVLLAGCASTSEAPDWLVMPADAREEAAVIEHCKAVGCFAMPIPAWQTLVEKLRAIGVIR